MIDIQQLRKSVLAAFNHARRLETSNIRSTLLASDVLYAVYLALEGDFRHLEDLGGE